VERKIPFAECQPVADAVAAIETELGDRGRVLLRYSGTESVCRVMVEGEHPEQVARLAEMLAETVQKHLR
jgi:phosphoglucosamine mutase